MQIAYFQIKGDGKRTNQDALFDGTNVHTAKLHHAYHALLCGGGRRRIW
ncbi:MAG: hypothetical protein Q3971_05230 [Moraxella sp.]|nr:hypothetical protein [Moraxella sp.]